MPLFSKNQIMVKTSFQQCKWWGTQSLLNLVIVSFLGVLLRYKISFSLPLVNYKYLLHAHSHFAFSGWVSMALFTAFVYMLSGQKGSVKKTYGYQFILAQIANFGMLISFPFQGYGAVSMSFSTLFIVFSYWFAWQYWKDLTKTNLPLLVKYLARAALFFFVISSSGPFYWDIFYRTKFMIIIYTTILFIYFFIFNTTAGLLLVCWQFFLRYCIRRKFCLMKEKG